MTGLTLLCLPLFVPATPQPLTLAHALDLAKARNGTLRAAALGAKASHEATNQSLSAFYPTITPAAKYLSTREQVAIGSPFTQIEGSSTYGNLSWRVLDSGERNLSLLSSRRAEDSSFADARQSLRELLRTVATQFLDSLRADEQTKIDSSQVDRSNEILRQTELRVSVGDEARKDILQAKADSLNAQVSLLQAQSGQSTAKAVLRGTLGLTASELLPDLAPVEPPTVVTPPPVDALLAQAVKLRPDLVSSRKTAESLRYSRLLLSRQAGPTFSADLSFFRNFTPDHTEARTMTLLVSMPLFDGGLTRAAAQAAKFNEMAAQARYDQLVLTARSDIESARATLLIDSQRLESAKAALAAAQENYAAALESKRLGASTLIDVLTAQVSLVTAESNHVAALYDLIEADVNFRLVTGLPMLGEETTP